MSVLGRNNILEADDLVTEPVDVPEWGGTVLVRTLTGIERDKFELSVAGESDGSKKTRQQNLANLRARLVVQCAVDEKGVRLFADGDADKLGKKSSRALGKVFDAASKLNGLSDEDVEKLAGNSEAAPSGSSTSD